MKHRILPPVLPFLALPLLSVAAFGQMTGVAHPDPAVDDATVPAQTDHYVKPSHDSALNPTAPTVAASPQATYAAPSSGYQNSYAATGPVPTSAPTNLPDPAMPPTPALIVRQPASSEAYAAPATVQTASVRRESLEPVENDNGIVSTMPNVPFQVNAGTVLRVRLEQNLSTEHTAVCARFTA